VAGRDFSLIRSLWRRGAAGLPALLRGCREGLLVIAISLVALEIALQAVVRLGYLGVSLPSYSLAEAEPFWQDLNADFGVWHPPNAHFRHRKSCFDVSYDSNSHGMRDREVTIASTEPRVVVVGDSFVEGWGVEYGQRFTERLEELTGIKHLNFGTSGDFGSTQAFILYRSLAAKFDHRAVIFAIFPGNDFLDDRPLEWRLQPGARHRPYLVGTYPHYELRYPAGEFLPGWRKQSRLKTMLYEFWLTARVVDYAIVAFRQAMVARAVADEWSNQSHYFDYKREEFDRLRYAIEQIKAVARDRPVLIFTIPVMQDYLRAAAADRAPPLTQELRTLSANLGITYFDLLELIEIARVPKADVLNYYLRCDGHWAETAHRIAAEALAKWDFYRR
jgi:lysophospholipase L1-like esterase